GKYEDVGKGFRADLGFLPQVDERSGTAGGECSIWGSPEAWYTRFGFGGQLAQSSRHDGGLLQRQAEAWIFGAGPMESWLKLDFGTGQRSFGGRTFDQTFLNTVFQISPSGGLYLHLDGAFGGAIDFANVRAATQVLLNPGVRVSFGKSLQAQFEHT